MDVEVSEATLVIYKHIHLLIRGGIEGVAGAEFSVPLLGTHTCLDLIFVAVEVQYIQVMLHRQQSLCS